MLNSSLEEFYMFAVTRLAKKFYEGKYEKILRINKIMYTNRVPSVVYRNLFRILSLFETNNTEWKYEYGLMLKNEHLDVLGDADAFYMRMFMLNHTQGIVDVIGVLDLGAVSDITKKLFPIDFNSPPFNVVSISN